MGQKSQLLNNKTPKNFCAFGARSRRLVLREINLKTRISYKFNRFDEESGHHSSDIQRGHQIRDLKIPNMCNWSNLLSSLPHFCEFPWFWKQQVFENEKLTASFRQKVKSHRIYFTIFLRFCGPAFGRPQNLN